MTKHISIKQATIIGIVFALQFTLIGIFSVIQDGTQTRNFRTGTISINTESNKPFISNRDLLYNFDYRGFESECINKTYGLYNGLTEYRNDDWREVQQFYEKEIELGEQCYTPGDTVYVVLQKNSNNEFTFRSESSWEEVFSAFNYNDRVYFAKATIENITRFDESGNPLPEGATENILDGSISIAASSSYNIQFTYAGLEGLRSDTKVYLSPEGEFSVK